MLVDIDLLLVDEVGAGGKSYASGALGGNFLYQAAIQCVYSYRLLMGCGEFNVTIALLNLYAIEHDCCNVCIKVDGERLAVGVSTDECGHV